MNLMVSGIKVCMLSGATTTFMKLVKIGRPPTKTHAFLDSVLFIIISTVSKRKTIMIVIIVQIYDAL